MSTYDPNLTLLFIFGTLLITAFSLAVIISLIIQKQRQVRNKLARQQLAFDYEQSLLHTRLEVQETTLNMLAQELHDNINQTLTAVTMQLSAASEYERDARGRRALTEAKTHIKTAIADIRLLSHSLATGLVEQRDLPEAIQAELDRVQAFSKVLCRLETHSLFQLEPEQRLLLFRIVQEALQNIIKHAQAANIQVVIDSGDHLYTLTVSDDGRGFEPADPASPASLGLMNMRERVKLLKGTIRIESGPGKGTFIEIGIPIQAST